MPFQINDPEIERRIDDQAKCSLLRPSKRRLIIAILEAVLDLVECERISIDGALAELRRRARRARDKTTA